MPYTVFLMEWRYTFLITKEGWVLAEGLGGAVWTVQYPQVFYATLMNVGFLFLLIGGASRAFSLFSWDPQSNLRSSKDAFQHAS